MIIKPELPFAILMPMSLGILSRQFLVASGMVVVRVVFPSGPLKLAMGKSPASSESVHIMTNEIASTVVVFIDRPHVEI